MFSSLGLAEGFVLQFDVPYVNLCEVLYLFSNHFKYVGGFKKAEKCNLINIIAKPSTHAITQLVDIHDNDSIEVQIDGTGALQRKAIRANYSEIFLSLFFDQGANPRKYSLLR